MGFKAVELLEQNIGNRVVAMQGGKIVDLDINEALDMPRVFDEELYKIAMTISIDLNITRLFQGGHCSPFIFFLGLRYTEFS